LFYELKDLLQVYIILQNDESSYYCDKVIHLGCTRIVFRIYPSTRWSQISIH